MGTKEKCLKLRVCFAANPFLILALGLFVFIPALSVNAFSDEEADSGGELFPDKPFKDWGLDYKAGAATRTLPFGLSFSGEIGYSKLLWGQPKESKLYGYLRPFFRANTSFVINRAQAGLALFPVSFIGASWGVYGSHRNVSKLSTLNCDNLQCGGSLRSVFIRPQVTLGHAGFFGVAIWRWDWITVADTTRPFGEETANLAGQAGADILGQLDIYLGYTRDSWSGGFLFNSAGMAELGSTNQLKAIFVRKQVENWKFTAGSGLYRSSTQEAGMAAFLALDWIGLPSLEL